MLRFFDFIFSLLGILILSPLVLILYILALFDTGRPILVQKRVGRHKEPFKLYKFRTMHLSTKPVASHLAEKKSVTRFGRFLRKSKLDEIPQLINVLSGNMSLVGARPTIPEQTDVIRERDRRGVYAYRPGITGLSQINCIDTSMPQRQAMIDIRMLKNLTVRDYFRYIFATVLGKGMGDRVPDLKKENINSAAGSLSHSGTPQNSEKSEMVEN